MEIIITILAIAILITAVVVMSVVLWKRSKERDAKITDNSISTIKKDAVGARVPRPRVTAPDSKYSISARYSLDTVYLRVHYRSKDRKHARCKHINVVMPNFTVENNLKINGDYIELYDSEGILCEVYTTNEQDELTKLSDLATYERGK